MDDGAAFALILIVKKYRTKYAKHTYNENRWHSVWQLALMNFIFRIEMLGDEISAKKSRKTRMHRMCGSARELLHFRL